jgi:hypothetical protein
MGNLRVEFSGFTGSTPVGMRVQYRILGSGGAYTTYNTTQTTSPIIIAGVDASYAYEGFISAECANGAFSNEVPFIVYPPTIMYAREYDTPGVYSFNMITGASVLKIEGFTNKLGVTRNKIFMGVSGGIEEHAITLDPYTHSLTRTISWGIYSQSSFQGFCAVDDNNITTVRMSDKKVVNINVSGVSAVFTDVFALHRTDVSPCGGIIYNHVDDTYHLTYLVNGSGDICVTSYESNGTLIGEYTFPEVLRLNHFENFYTLFQYGTNIYVVMHTGRVFKFKQSGSTLIWSSAGNSMYNTGVLNGSQIPEYNNMNIPA